MTAKLAASMFPSPRAARASRELAAKAIIVTLVSAMTFAVNGDSDNTASRRSFPLTAQR
jgi:hypothetical protein